MSLANDQTSLITRYIAANAAIAAAAVRSGFTNVVLVDSINFASGNRHYRHVFMGETAPGTDYDSVSKIGDEYWQWTYSSGAPSAIAKYLRTASGWEQYITGASNKITLAQLGTGITPSHIVAVCKRVTTAGGAANEDITVTGLLTTDLINAVVVNNGTNNVTIHEYACSAAGFLDVTFGADPSTDTVLLVTALRTAA